MALRKNRFNITPRVFYIAQLSYNNYNYNHFPLRTLTSAEFEDILQKAPEFSANFNIEV